MSGLFETMYKPYFQWQRTKPKPAAKRMFDMTQWDESTPSMLLSDSDDEASVPDTPRRKPLHLEKDTDPPVSERHVRFGQACVREHPVILGDHASCCDIWPLSLDWAFREEKVYEINDYEEMRERCGRTERGRLSKIGAAERRRILEQAGTEQPYINDEYYCNNIPVQLQDVGQFGIEVLPSEEASIGCDPFSLFQDAGWGMCGFRGELPTMSVQILED